MSPIAILKLLKTAKDIHDYVKKENNLDQQMGSVRSRLEKLEQKISCKRCERTMNEASDMIQSTGDESI
tara:strand:+ start:234 stop:440 length:207 start_codon:yes stop_codon:yes gene_type:complete